MLAIAIVIVSVDIRIIKTIPIIMILTIITFCDSIAVSMISGITIIP